MSARQPAAPDEAAVVTALDAMRSILQEVRIANRGVEQELGISGAQLFVLEELARAPADSLNDLAARAGTRHSSMSIVVTRLVEAELVTRVAARDDARRVQLALTARGRRVLRGAPPSAQARLLTAARTLPAAQVTQLAAALSAWCGRFVGGDDEATDETDIESVVESVVESDGAAHLRRSSGAPH